MSDLFGDLIDDSPVARVTDRLLSGFRAERPVYAWADRWLANAVAIVSGRGGCGKTTYVLDKLAKATVGTLPGIYQDRPVPVALVGPLEDGAGQAKLRMTAAGADLGKVHIPEFYDEDGVPEPFDIAHLETLKEYIADHSIRLVMLDMLNTLIRDDSKRADVKQVLPLLNQAAYETGCAIIGINHFRKSGGLGSDLMAGSAALRDHTRSLVLIAKDDEGKRIATLDKLNLSTHEGESWQFTLESIPVLDDYGDPTDIAKVVELGESDENVETVVNRMINKATATGGGDQDERTEAEAWLEDYLTANPGVESKTAKAAERKALGCTERTIQRAAQALGVVAESHGFPRMTTWTLPVATPSPSALGNVATVATDPTGFDKGKHVPSWPQSVQLRHASPSRPTDVATVATGPVDDPTKDTMAVCRLHPTTPAPPGGCWTCDRNRGAA